MGLRSPKEFEASLRDDRRVYYNGERVQDVTSHQHLRIGVGTARVEYELAENPTYRDVCTVVRDDGELYSRYLQSPRTAADLLARREVVELGARYALGFPPFAKDGGSDALNAASVASAHLDKELGTGYHVRVEAFRRFLQDGDLSLAVAMTDVKGDRSLRPSQQEHPDYYLHIVERRPDGIVVRGAKAHITSAPHTNEVLVLPTRAMTREDADYAVAFAVPVNSPGITVVARPGAALDEFDFPVSSRFDMWEGLVIFDNVFVPTDRIFLAGEWQFAGLYTGMFANFHRFTASCYKYASGELLVGAAQCIAEYNGIDRAPHVREKIAWLAMYAETIHGLTLAAASSPVTDPLTGVCYPDPVLGNAVKFYFADNYHTAIKQVQDLAGGLTVTAPMARDIFHPELAPLIEHYLGAGAKAPALERLRMFKFIRDFTAGDTGGLWQVTSIHAEGSLAAEKLAVYREADLDRYRRLARRAAGITSLDL